MNPFARYQRGLAMEQIFPSREGECSCGCGMPLTGQRRRWASTKCNQSAYIHFAIIKGNGRIIRQELWKRDHGFCRKCGVLDDRWQADHIVEVVRGGSACDLSGFQTLCLECHHEKTKQLQAIPPQLELFAIGANLVHGPHERFGGAYVLTGEDVN